MKFKLILLMVTFSSIAGASVDLNFYGNNDDPLSGIDIRDDNKDIPYNRRLYSYGIDSDHDGQNTRAELLILSSTKTVTFTNDSKKTVKSGRWFDPYTGVTFASANDVDIDHLVPLYEVHISGGYAWPADKKRAFANDLGPGSPLRVTHRWTNRIPKNADDPTLYSPSYVPARCQYLADWISIKKKWGLSMDQNEANSVRKQIRACG